MAKKSPEDPNPSRQPLAQRPSAAPLGSAGATTRGLPERAPAPVPASNGLGALGYAAEVSAHLHDQLGNQIVLDTLRGPDDAGLEGFVALELSSAVAGLQGEPASLSSNEALLRHLGPSARETMTAAEALRVARASAGAPLPEGLRQRLEGALGRDLSHVRVHVGGAADRAARGVNALAFTVGRDVYFRSDAWAPGTEEGDRVLLHELTHVAQEDDGRVTTPQAGADLSRPTDPLEREASQAEAPGLAALTQLDDAFGGWDEGVGYLQAPLETGHDPGGEAPSAAALLPQRDPLHLLPTQPQDLLERVRRAGSLPPAVRQQLERALGEPSEALRAGGEALERLMGVGEALLGEPVEQLDPLQAALKGVFSAPESRPQTDGQAEKSPLDAVVGAVLTPHSTEDGGDSVPQDTPSSVASNHPELVGGAETEGAGPKLAPVADQLVQGGRRLRGELDSLTRGVMRGLGVPSGAEEELRAGLEPALSGIIASMERAASRFGGQLSESGAGGKPRGEVSQPLASALHEPAPGQALVARGPQGAPASAPTQINAQTAPGEGAAPSPLVAFTERLRGFPQRLVEGLGDRERIGGSLESILSIPLSEDASAPGEGLLSGLLKLAESTLAPRDAVAPVVVESPSPAATAPAPELVNAAMQHDEEAPVDDAAMQQDEAPAAEVAPVAPVEVVGPEATPAAEGLTEAAPTTAPIPAEVVGTEAPVVTEAPVAEEAAVTPAETAPAETAAEDLSAEAAVDPLAAELAPAPAGPGESPSAPGESSSGPTLAAPPSAAPYDAAAHAQRLGAESARRLRELAELARQEEVAAQQETQGTAEAEADPAQNLVQDPLAALKGREPVTDQLLGALTGDSGVQSQVVKDVQQSVMASIADAPQAEPQSTTPVEPMSPELALAGLGDRLASVLDELPNVMGDPFADLADRSVGGKVKADPKDMAAVGREAFMRHVGGGLGFGKFDALIRDELVRSSPPERSDEPVAPATSPAASGPSFTGAQLLNRLGATLGDAGSAPPTTQAAEEQAAAPAATPSTLPPAAELEGAAKASELGIQGIGATLNTMVGMVSDGAMAQASLGESELLSASSKLQERLLSAASTAPPLVAPVMPDLAAGFAAEAAPELSFAAEESGVKAELPEAGSILPQGGLGAEGLTKLLSLEGKKIAPIVPVAVPLDLQAPAADMTPKAELGAVVAQSFSDAETKASAGVEALTSNTAESLVTVEAEVTTNATQLAATATQLTTTTDEVVTANIAELAQSHTEAMSASTARNAQSAAAVMGLSAKGAAVGDKLAQDAGKTAKAPPNTDKPKVGPGAEAFAADPGGANAQLGRDVDAQRRGAESRLAEVTAQDPEQTLTGEARELVLREAEGAPEEALVQGHAQEGEAALKEAAEEAPEGETTTVDEEQGPTAADAEAVEGEEGAQTATATEEDAQSQATPSEEVQSEEEVSAEEVSAEEGAEDEVATQTAANGEERPASGEAVSETDAAAAESAVEAAPETMASALGDGVSAPIPSPDFGAMLQGAGLGLALGADGFDLLGALDLSLSEPTTPMELGGLTDALSALSPMLDEKAVAGLAAQLDPTAAVGAAQEAAKAKLAAAAAQIPAAADAAAAQSSAALQQNLNQQAAAAESQAAASAGAQHDAVDSGASAQSAQIGAQLSQAELAEQARIAAEQQVVAELLVAREASIEAQRPPIVSQITTVGQTQTQAQEQAGEVQKQSSEVTKEGLLQQVETLKTSQVAVLEQTATQAKTELAAEVTQRKAELKQQAEQLKQTIEEKFKTEVQNLDKAVTEGTTLLQTQKTENDAKVKAETQTKIQERRVEGARAAREAMNSIIQRGRAQQEASYARAEEHRQSEYAKADAVLAEAQARFSQIMAEANAKAASSNPLEKFAANAIYGRANGVLADGEAKAAGIRANGDSTCASMKAEADAQMVVEVGNANKQFDAMMQQTEMALEQLRAAEQQALQANEQLLKAGLEKLKQEREMAFQRADQQRRYAIIGVDSDVAIGEMKIEEERARAEQEIQTTLDAAKTALEAQCSALKEQIQSAHQSNLQQIQSQVNSAKSEIQAAVQQAQAQVQTQVVTARQEMRVIADQRVQSMVQESAQRIVRFQTEARTGVARVQQTAQAYHGHIDKAFNNQILPGLRQKQNEIAEYHMVNMAEMKEGAIAGAEARNRYYAGQINDQALKSASWSNNQVEQFRAGADGDLGRVAQLNLNMAGEHYTNFQDLMGKRVFENNTIYRDYRSDLYEKGTQLADMLAQEGAAQTWEKGGPAGVAVGFLFLGVNAVAQGGRYHIEKQMIRNAVDIGGPGLLGVPMRVDQNGNAVPDILTLKDDQILRQFGFRNYLMAGPNGPVEGLRLPDGRVVSRASLSQDPRASTAVLGAMSNRFTQDGGPLISQQENIQDTLVYTGTKFLSDTVQAGKSYAENRLSSSGAFKGLTQDPGAMVAYAVGKGALWSAIDQGSDSLTSWMRGEGDLSALAQRNFTERFFETWAAETVGEISGGIMEKVMGSAGRKLSRVIPADVQNRIAGSATNVVMRQAIGQLGEVIDRVPFARTLIRESMDFLGSLPEEVFSESLSNFSSNLVTGIRTGELQKAFEEYQRTGDASALLKQRDALLKGVFDGEALESAVTESLNEKVTGRLGDRMGSRRDAQMTQRDTDRLQAAVQSGNTQEINRLVDQINRSTDARVDNLNDQLPRMLQSAPPQVQDAVRQRLQADNQRVTDARDTIDAREGRNAQNPLRLSRSTVGIDADSTARVQSRNDVDQLIQATQRSDAAAIGGLVELVQQGSPRRAETIARNLPELLQNASPEVQAQVRDQVRREAEAAAALLARQRAGYRVDIDTAAAERLIALSEALNPGESAAPNEASAANPEAAAITPDPTTETPANAAPEATTTPDTPDPSQDVEVAAAVVSAFETALPNEIAAVVRGLYDNGAGLDAVVAQMDSLVANGSPEAKAAMGRQLMADGHAWQANPDGYDKDVVARMMTLGRAYADATARLGQDPYGNQIERTLSVITEDYSAFKERLQVYQANIGAWTDMDLPYTMWTYFGNIARYEGTEVNVFAPADGVRAVAPTYNPETGEIGFAQNDDGSLRQSVTVKEIESAESLVIFGIDPSSGAITIQEGVQLNLGMNKALSMANPTPAPQPTQIQAPEAQPPEAASPEDGVQLSLLDQTSALVQAFETGQPMDVAAAVQSLYATGAGLDSVVAQMDTLVANASPEAKAAMGRQLMADGHAWQANPDGYDKDVVARMMTLGRAYADATARLGQDPYGNQIERTLSVITEDYSAFKERLQVYQANIGAWTDMDLPYTMWTYFGNIARYEGTEVNVFAPADGVRAVAPTYNPETGEIDFAQNDDGSLRQSVTVKEIESAASLVIFGIDPSSGAITIQDGVQFNLGMNKALSMANPTPAPTQVPAVEAPEAQTPTTASPEDRVQLSIFDADAGRAAPEQSTRDIGLAPEPDTATDTDADGRKATVVGSDQNQSPPKPDLSVTPPEETDQVVQPTVAQENVAAAPPTSPLFQQLRGIVASMLYDVPEAAPAIAETMGLSAEGLQLLRDNDNAQSWADLTAAGLSDADRAALQHAAALKLVSTLDPDQPASLFLSWFDWHIGTQADFTITQPHLQNAINMDNAGMDEVAAVMGLANFKRLVLSTHGLPGGQIMKTEEGAGFNIYDARIMAELAERAGVNSVLLAHCYGALGADGVNTLDVDSRQASGSSIAEFSSRGMDVSAYEGAVNTRTATQMVGVWSELIAAGVPDEAALQLAGAFANATGGENLNSINWSQYVSHARAELGPEGDPQAWANRNGFVDTQIRGRRVGPEQILQLLIQYGDVLLATQGAQDAPKAWKGRIPENQVDLLARMTVNDLIYGGLYPQAGVTGADAQMIVALLGQAWSGAPLVQDGALPEWAVLGARLYFALEGQVAAIQHMDPAERAQRANVLQNLQIMRDEVWIQLAAAGEGIIDAQGQIAFLPPTDLTHYATSDTALAQSAAPAQVDGVTVADVTQSPGDTVTVDPNAPVQTLLFDLAEVGAATRSLPTPGLVGGITSPAAPAPQGDDGQRRQDVLAEARAHFKPMLSSLLTRSATRGTGAREDRALNGLRAVVEGQLDTFRRSLAMKGLDAAWVTTDVVLDMLARDTELARALQEATPGLGIEPGQLLATLDPAHRLATQLKEVKGDGAAADDTRLGLLRDTLHRTDGALLLTGLRGGELITEVARIKDPVKRALAMEMLQTGQALALGDQHGAPRVERVTRGLDGTITREAAALATELSVLGASLDTQNPRSKENTERLAAARARVAEALADLRDVQSRLNDPNLNDTDRQALEARRAALTQAATKVMTVVTRSGSLLSTLAMHDNTWYAETLLPYLREAGGAPVAANVTPQRSAAAETFWVNHKLDAKAMSTMKPDDLRRLLERMIQEASAPGAEGRALLAEFARRYSQEHGSFHKLLNDAFNAHNQLINLSSGKNDPSVFRALAHAFGLEVSDAFAGVDLNAGAQPISLKEEVQLIQLVTEAAEKIRASFNIGNFTSIAGVMRELQSSATVTSILSKIATDPAKRAEIIRKAVRAAFKESYGELAARLTERALKASWSNGESIDAQALGYDKQELLALEEERQAFTTKVTFDSSEDRIQKYYDSHPNVAQTRLAADKRAALYTGDAMAVLEGVLKLSAEDRLKALNDPFLTTELANKHGELWPFMRHALEGQVPPQEMLTVLIALKQAINLGLKPGEVLKAAKDAAPKGDYNGFGMKILTMIGKSAGTDVLQRAQQRMQPEMQKLIEGWASWRGAQLEEQDPSLKGNKDERARRLQAEALDMLADPDLQAFLRDGFSAEQRASITSVMMSGSTSNNDKAQQSRLGLGVDAKNVLSVVQKAYEDGKTAALREDPAVLAQLQKLGEGERQLALQLLFDTPLAQVLSVMKVQGDLSDDNAFALLGKLATMSVKDRDSLRNNPALLLFLSSKLKGESLARFQRLMQLNGRGEAQATPTGLSEQDRERDWLRLRAVEGVQALIAAKDDAALLKLAVSLFKAKVTDPNAQAPGFAERAEQGARAGDLSAQDRPMMAEALRSSAEYAELIKRSPTLAAAVMDAVLGQRDPTPMLYHAEAARSWLNADVAVMVKAIEDVSADEFLTQFVDLDSFAPFFIGAMSARQALASLPADASDDQRQAAEQAVTDANMAMRAATFDLSASRLAELSSLSKADQQTVLDAVRARVNKLLGGEAKDELALVARALQGAIGRVAPQSGLTVDETLLAEVSSADRLARSQLAQAQTDMARSRKAVESVAALLPRFAVKLPGGLDLKKNVEEAEQALRAWSDALAAASQSDAPLTDDQQKVLKERGEAAEKAKKSLTESFDKVVATASKHLNTAFEAAMNAGEVALITAVTLSTGGVATMPVTLLLSAVKPAVKKLVGLWIDRALRDEQRIRRADIAPAIVEVIKENVNEGWKQTMESSPVIGLLAEGLAQIVALNLPFIDGKVEDAADKQVSGKIEGQTKKLEDLDDALAKQAGDLINRENRRRGPADAGGDVYGDSARREQALVGLRQGVRQRLEERARQRGLRANDPVVTQTAAALQATLGDGDVGRLQALVTEHGVEKLQGLLHNVVRPEDDARLEDKISGPLRQFLHDLASGGPGNQRPGAVGGLTASTPDNSAESGRQSAANNTRSSAPAESPRAAAPERVETLEASSGRSLRGGNVAGVADRAAARLSSMASDQAAEVQAILHDPGVSPSARALLERGLAAGYGLSELRLLRDLTVNRSDAELLAEFTGLGLSQIGQVSCLPTAYQIAIAEQDPLYAYRLRQNPQALSTQDGGGGVVFTQAEIEQLRVLRERDGETSLASMPLDLAKIVLPALRSRGIDPSSRAALDEVDRILASLGAPVQRGNQGLDVTQFTQDAALHETLEARVGQELALAPMNLQDVQAALAQGHPVPVLTAAESLMGDRRVADAHAQVILSFDGERYTVHDPQGGGVRQLTAAELQQALGARWALLPTGAAVSPQATTSGGVTSPAPLGGDDPQRRLDAAQAVKTVMNDATVASLAAEMGAGDQRGDAPLNRLRAAIDARLTELRAQTQAAGEDTSWLTTEFVLDLISQDVALRRGLQRGLVGTDANRAEVLAAIEPAHRLAEAMNAASTDKARLAAVAEAVSRVGGELRLLESGVSGHELIGALARFESDEDRMVAQEMLQTGKVLTWLGSGANRGLMVENRALDGARAPLTERVSLLTELCVLANSVDPKRPEEAKERLEGVRARVTQTLGRLRALRAERQDMSLPAAQRDAAKAELLALEAEIKAIARGPLRSGGVLAALSAHDPSWTTDSLVPLLTEAQGGPVALSPDLAARQAALPLWRDHANDLAALKSMSVNKRKAFFERIIRDAQRHGGDPKQQLAEVARRYAEEHGSLSVVIRDTFARQGQDLSGRSPVRDMGGLRATLDAFGFESSAVMDTVDPVTGGSDHAQRAQVIEAVHDASTAILNGMNKLLIGDRAGHVDRALRRLTERLEAVYGASLADPTTRAALARQSVGVALGETHGDLMGLVAQSSMATQDPNMFDAVVRALGIDPAQLGALVEEAKALKGGEETLDAHMAQNPTLQSGRLPSADRVALVEATKALPELLDTLLRMPPDQRALVRADPLLMATLARSQPEAWPFLKTVLNDTLSPVAMLQVMELLRYSVASGVDVKDLGLAAMKLGKDVLLSQGASLIKDSFSTLVDLGDTVITSVGGDLLKARTQRMQEDMTELLKDYVAWRDQQRRAQGTAAPPDEARALEAQSLLADPEFTRFLNESFSPEQRAAILSTLMHGEVDTSDTIRLERLNPLTQEARVLDPLREAWDDKEGEEGEKIGELRADPGALGRLSRVGEGRRAQALGMLLNTPLGKVLAEARARVDISGKNQWMIVNELAALSQADRDALRDDPATVETLASLITDGEALRSLQALLQVDENNLGDEIYTPGSSAQDKERAWLRTSSVAGLTAMMKHGDERLLLGLAAKIYRAQVIDPSQTPGFADRVTSGVRAGDLSAQDRGAIADALRATEDYQRLLKARPEVAAAVMDAVLGEVDPSAMLYERNVKREFLDASADDLVDIVQDMSVETFLTTMVNMDGFGVAYYALQSARQAQAGLPPSATADERTLAADAVRAAERAAREYAFDVRPERIAELKDLNNEDKEKVLQAARKRVELLLSGQQEGAMGEIARVLQSSMTQAGATAGVTLGEDEVKALFDRERGARNELLQAEQRLTEDKRVVQVLELVVGRLKIPGFDMKGELAEAEQSVAAWRAALTGFDGAGGPSQGDLETLQSLRAKAEAARAALLETHKKALETAQEQLKPLIKGAVGLLPGPLELAEPALEALATEYAGRVLKGESLTRKADLSRVVREHIKSQLGDQVDGLLKDTKILEGLDGLIDKLVGANLPLLEGVFEEVIDEKLKGKLDGLKDKLPEMDDKVAEMGEDRLNDGLRRVGATGGGEDRYTSSIQREQEHAAMFTTVSNALDERAAAMGAQVSASEVGQVQSALRAALGAGDVAALRSLTAALGVDVMSQLLFHPARPEDDVLRDETLARLSPAVRDPIVAWRDALRSGGPGAVGGLSEDPLQRAADDADQALQAALGDPDAPHRPHRGGSAEWCYARLQRLWRARLVSLGLADEELPKAEAVRAGLEEAILTGRPARLRAAMRDAGPSLARRLAGEVLAGTPVPKEHSAAIQAAVEDGSRGVAR